jgi:hypothetical protein
MADTHEANAYSLILRDETLEGSMIMLWSFTATGLQDGSVHRDGTGVQGSYNY